MFISGEPPGRIFAYWKEEGWIQFLVTRAVCGRKYNALIHHRVADFLLRGTEWILSGEFGRLNHKTPCLFAFQSRPFLWPVAFILKETDWREGWSRLYGEARSLLWLSSDTFFLCQVSYMHQLVECFLTWFEPVILLVWMCGITKRIWSVALSWTAYNLV